jgi:hypothetical protein
MREKGALKISSKVKLDPITNGAKGLESNKNNTLQKRAKIVKKSSAEHQGTLGFVSKLVKMANQDAETYRTLNLSLTTLRQ